MRILPLLRLARCAVGYVAFGAVISTVIAVVIIVASARPERCNVGVHSIGRHVFYVETFRALGRTRVVSCGIGTLDSEHEAASIVRRMSKPLVGPIARQGWWQRRAVSLLDSEPAALHDAVGWPLHVVEGQLVGPFRSNTYQLTRGCIVLEAGRSLGAASEWRLIPFRPLWLNLLASSCLYGTPIFIVAILVRGCRRRCRHSYGRCVQCGYDIKGLSVARCPECGVSVSDQ